jgi:hypothetical protein
LGYILDWFALVSTGALHLKARDGNGSARISIVDGNGKEMRPIFNETRIFELLQLPPRFNFSVPDLNLTRENLGDMISFSERELDYTSHSYEINFGQTKRKASDGGPKNANIRLLQLCYGDADSSVLVLWKGGVNVSKSGMTVRRR